MNTNPQHYSVIHSNLTKALRVLETSGVTIEDWQRVVNDLEFRGRILAAFGYSDALSVSDLTDKAKRLMLDDALAQDRNTRDYLDITGIDPVSFLDDASLQLILDSLSPRQRRIVAAYYLHDGPLYPPTVSDVASSVDAKESSVYGALESFRRSFAAHMDVTARSAISGNMRRLLSSVRTEIDAAGDEYVLAPVEGAKERLQSIVDNPTSAES